MTMADILAVISGLIIIGLGFPALFIILTITFPQAVERANLTISTKPLRTIARGLLTFIALALIFIITSHAHFGLFKLFNLFIVLGALTLAMLGGAGLANHLAYRYSALSNSRQSARNLFFSALLVELALVLPLIGWFVLLPITFLLMLGAGCEVLLNLHSHRNSHEQVAQPAIS